jgi:hypothetical protein
VDYSVRRGYTYTVRNKAPISRLGASSFIDVLIGLFGRSRARLAEWPQREVVESALAAFRDCGGELYSESGTPEGELEVMHLRVRGRRMRLCIADYGGVTLWGPKRMVAKISQRVTERLSEITEQKRGSARERRRTRTA